MKSALLIFSLLTLASCGPGKTGGKNPPVINPPAPVEDSSILSQFSNARTTLDFRLLTIGTEQSAQDVLNCDGNLGNAGLVNGVAEDSVLATGNEQNGTIQYGHLKYVGASDSQCRSSSKESYTYSITGTELTLCNVNCINNVYPSCFANPCEKFEAQ